MCISLLKQLVFKFCFEKCACEQHSMWLASNRVHFSSPFLKYSFDFFNYPLNDYDSVFAPEMHNSWRGRRPQGGRRNF